MTTPPCAAAVPETVESRLGLDVCAPSSAGDGERTARLRQLPWASTPDRRFGLGQLAANFDHVLGEAAFDLRPSGAWAVTTELAASWRVPRVRGPLTVRTLMSSSHGHDAAVLGAAYDGRGRLVATGSTRARFVDLPTVGWTPPAPALDPRHDVAALSIVDRLGGDRTGPGAIQIPTAGWLNQFGIVQGGVWSILLCQAALDLTRERHPQLEPASLSLTFVRPPRGAATIRAAATTTRAGREFGHVEVRGLDDADEVCAVASLTLQSWQ